MTLIRPVITEKSILGASRGAFTFEVEMGTRKSAVITLVQDLFKVKVIKVTTKTSHIPSKKTGSRRLSQPSNKSKFATVWLKKGQSIALFDLKEGK